LERTFEGADAGFHGFLTSAGIDGGDTAARSWMSIAFVAIVPSATFSTPWRRAPMASVTYYVVITFDRADDGALQPGEPQEVQSAEAARRRAASVAHAHAGVVAFSRSGDPISGEFEDAVILSQAGDVDLDALSV
jgi:hypothetical protein